MSTMATIAILGAGSWGTAVAIHLAKVGHQVRLWGHNRKEIEEMAKTRSNERYLPKISFPKTLMPEVDLTKAVQGADLVIIAVPSHAFSEVLAKIPQKPSGLAWLTKGVDPSTNRFLSELVAERYGDDFPAAIITGPSFAAEVAKGLPTALTIAGNQVPFLKLIHKVLHHGNIRTYMSEDLIGVQLGGAIKNVLAIACGISDGLQYGANAKAALITRGLAEMTRLGTAMQAEPKTFMGLACVGDLVLTCTDNQSRNRRFGIKLGAGESIDDAEKSIGQVVEGKYNAAQIAALAMKYHVELPICEAVNNLLLGKITPSDAVDQLMSRPAKGEF